MASVAREPSFFIVGAPKCGTTALCKYLNRHPEIFIPTAKELCFFDTDLNTDKKAHNLSEYLALFAPGVGKICGEGSPTYLYSETAAQAIYEFNSDAKIIILLRHPVEVMHALHSQEIFNGFGETETDFEQALALESVRKQGQSIPKHCSEPKKLFYRDRVCFSEQVKRYLDVFGRDRVLILLFEDFTQETARVFQETLRFIGADPNFSTDFNPVNANKKVRHRWLQGLLKYPPQRLLSLGKYLLPLPQATRRALLEGAKAKLKRLNTQKAPRPPLLPALRHQLTQELAPEIQALSALIERDLSHWLDHGQRLV